MRTSRALPAALSTALPTAALVLVGLTAGASHLAPALVDAPGARPAPPSPAASSPAAPWTVTVPTTKPAPAASSPAAPWTVTKPTTKLAPKPTAKPAPKQASRQHGRHLAAKPSTKPSTHHGRHVAHRAAVRKVVRPGDTLSGLFGTRWPRVAEAYHLPDPDLIFPGQVFIG